MTHVPDLRTMLGTPTALRRVALASVVTNVGIVITGGAVRLTGSGLGCPTWPRCTPDSYVATAAMGVNGAIEFGNRMLTLVLGLVAVLGFVTAILQQPRTRRVTRLAAALVLAIPLQAVVGGVTVLTGLNPWVVAGHFLLSIAVITVAYAFWVAARNVVARNVAARGEDTQARATVARPLHPLAALVVAASAAVLAVGTVVTGSGPHAGSAHAPRTGFDPAVVAQLHADLVCFLIGLTVALWLALRAAGAREAATTVAWLAGIEAAQGLVGIIQYVTGVPALIVGAHLAGACAVWLATLAMWYATAANTRTDGHGAGEAQSRATMASASRVAAPDPTAQPRYSDGSVSSTSTTAGSPSASAMRSTRA
jgi:heme a synthase